MEWSKYLGPITNQNFILGNTTVDEQVSFINSQIDDPFNSGDANYYKKLKKMITSQDELDSVCAQFCKQIENRYPELELDFDSYDQRISSVFPSIYKFFIKNIYTLMYLFLREYIFNNKNRKNLLAEFSNIKLPNYPKEQYGKKEYYILITKLAPIVKLIRDEDVRLSKFIEYIDRTDDSPLYLTTVKELVDKGVIVDHGVLRNFFSLLFDCDQYQSMLNDLEIDITGAIILPYLEETGLIDVRMAPIEKDDPDISDDDDEEDSDDGD